MVLLGWARLLVAGVPFGWWRGLLGTKDGRARPSAPSSSQLARARRIAGAVDRAAQRLPFDTKCLPRAMALSWLLRRAAIPHALVIAVRPQDQRDTSDALHAWVEVAGARIIGDLPGSWLETFRAG